MQPRSGAHRRAQAARTQPYTRCMPWFFDALGTLTRSRTHIAGSLCVCMCRLFDPVGGEHMNIMKVGLQTAHRLVAVSHGYAWECLTPEGGWGLHMVLNVEKWKLRGIVNGIDYNEWNPAIDKHLQVRTLTWLTVHCMCVMLGSLGWAATDGRHLCACDRSSRRLSVTQLRRARTRLTARCCYAHSVSWSVRCVQGDGYTNYDIKTFVEGKRKCKMAIQRELGLPVDPNIPMLGFIGRLDYQKVSVACRPLICEHLGLPSHTMLAEADQICSCYYGRLDY